MIVDFEWSVPRRGSKAPPRPKFDVCLTTYEMLAAAPDVFRREDHWGYIVVDEAHRLKNRKAKCLVILRDLRCDVKLALTGTPVSVASRFEAPFAGVARVSLRPCRSLCPGTHQPA